MKEVLFIFAHCSSNFLWKLWWSYHQPMPNFSHIFLHALYSFFFKRDIPCIWELWSNPYLYCSINAQTIPTWPWHHILPRYPKTLHGLSEFFIQGNSFVSWGRIALCEGSVIYLCSLLLKLFVQAKPTISEAYAKFQPQLISQFASPNSQSSSLARSFVKQVQARCVQWLWNFAHLFTHPNNSTTPILSLIQQA